MRGRISSCEEGTVLLWLGDEYNVKRGGSNIIYLKILRLLERISSGEEGRNLGEENQDEKNCGGGKYRVIENIPKFIPMGLKRTPIYYLYVIGRNLVPSPGIGCTATVDILPGQYATLS